MRIFHCITSVSRGGSENQLFSLIQRQRADGHDVAVAYLNGTGYWTRPLEALGVPVHWLKMRFRGEPGAWPRLVRALRGFRPDVLHAHLQPAELYSRLALLCFPELPFVISKRNAYPRFAPVPFQRALGRWAGGRADAVIAVSRAAERNCLAQGYCEADRIVVVPNGVDVEAFEAVSPEAVAALRRQWGVRKEEWVVGTIARLAKIKALDVLIEGFAACAAGSGRPMRLVLVGRGPEEGALRARAAAAGVSGSVVLAGFREDIPIVQSAFDVFALTSDNEGLPGSVLEAMAAGKPVAATAVGGVPEVVEEGVTGFLVPPRRPDLLAGALAKLADPAVRAELGEAGRRRASERFSARAAHEGNMAVYRRCLEARRR